MEAKVLKTPEVLVRVDEEVEKKLILYVESAPQEIGGLLEAEMEQKEGRWIVNITNIHLIKQDASSGSFTVDPEAMANYMSELLASKSKGNAEKIHGWWHSHAHLGVFWSGTDDAEFNHLLEYFGDWTIGIVANKKGEILWRLDVNTPYGVIKIDQIPYVKELRRVKTLRKKIESEVRKKVSESVVENTDLSPYARQLNLSLPSETEQKTMKNYKEEDYE